MTIYVIKQSKEEGGSMSIISILAFRKNVSGVVRSVIEYNEPVIVNTKKGNAVILSEEDYNSMLETIYLVSQPGLVEKIKEGEKESVDSTSDYCPSEEW